MNNPSTPERGLRILIADDHAIVREGLKRVLENSAPGWTVTDAASGQQVLQLLQAQPVDLCIFDLSMPGMNGLELLKRVRADWPRLPVLMLSMHAEEQYAARAFRAGANGYLTKDSAPAELAQAVRKLAAGGRYVSAALAERLVLQLNGLEPAPAHAGLSDRELDVLRRLAEGQRPTDIAAALHLSVKTVSSHKTRILDKLHLPGTAALVRYAVAHGLAAPSPLVDEPPADPA